MGVFQEKISASRATYPATAVMRNYLNSHPVYATRTAEWGYKGVWSVQLDLYNTSVEPKVRCFSTVGRGVKNVILEEGYLKMAKWLDANTFKTQGLDEGDEVQDDLNVVKPDEVAQSSVAENVIITGAEDSKIVPMDSAHIRSLLSWSSTEKYYEFMDNSSGVMNRWFPLDSVKITTSDGPSVNGGLKQTWRVPGDIFVNAFDSINVLPVRGFVLGRYNLEFKMTLQANPFQACCVMLSQCPNDYGLVKFESIKAFTMNSTLDPKNMTSTTGIGVGYDDFRVAIQRPHVLVDVSSGGEATMQFSQKYHKTLIRNFDYSFVPEVNPGLQGSYYGSIALHVLAPLRVGTGSSPNFNVRIFYRFVEAQLTGMSSTAVKNATNRLIGLRPIPLARRGEAKRLLDSAIVKSRARKPGDKDPYSETVRAISDWATQGPAMSIISTARGVVDVADKALHVVEDFGVPSRKGFNVKNRDKPNDTVHVVKVIPRPRNNFMNGEGIDDALVLGLSWVELTQFFEVFENEPKSIKDFVSKMGFLGTFSWDVNQSANVNLFEWNVHPTITPGVSATALDSNFLSSPLGIASSFYTNYFGTMELYFQFIKTQYHKGSVEVAIHFGRSITGSGLSSSYVKILNVQECNGFSVTVPYIYDTAVRTIAGTSTPMVIPPLYNNGMYQFAHSAKVNVKVVNELVAPESVHSSLDVLVWIKGGSDFGLNFPRACNTLSSHANSRMALLPQETRKVFSSPQPPPQYFYSPNGVTNITTLSGGFYTQGDDDTPDFNQPIYEGNRNTNIEHLNFKTLLKMPIKILNNYEVSPTVEQEYVVVNGSVPGDVRKAVVKNYFMLPVTVLNPTLLNYLNQYAFSRTNAFGGINFPLNQSIHNQITQMFGMFRGSIVYTIVLNSGKSANISYLPHDYVTRPLQGPLNGEGNVFEIQETQQSAFPSWNVMDSLNVTDIGACLPYTTFMNSQVNPSEKVIIPMSNPNNWLLLNRKLPTTVGTTNQGITTLRESLEWFNGHLLIWSDDTIKIDVYVNCGDDFELGGFIGHTGVANPYSLYALQDNWRTQGPQDFRIKELTSQGWNSFKSMAIGAAGSVVGAIVTKTLVECEQPGIAAVTGAIAIYSCVGGIEQIQRLRKVLKEGSNQVDNINKMADEVCEVGVETVVKILQSSFPFLRQVNSVGKTVWVVAQHIIHSVLSNNWRNVAFGFFCVLMETKIFELHDWALLKDKLVSLITAYCPGTQNFTTQGDTLQELGESVMQVIASMICAKLQIKGTGGLSWYLKEMFAWQNYKHVSGMNSILTFSKTFFRAVSNIFTWLFAKADPNVSLIKALSAQDVEITEFLEESNLYLNNFNDNDFKRRDMRIRFLRTIMRAFKLRLVLLRIANPRMTGQLLQHCNKVIDKAQKQRYLFKCDVVKTEPFVLCIEGNTNVGKSFAVTDVVSSMLNSVNYKGPSEDILFTVAAGVDYWNGYADQPAVVYDDWCNLRDEQTLRQHISQLYQLKTSAPFNVPRAELENKEQIASPQIVVLSTNVPFPTSSIFNCPAAVWRRRDCMIKVTLQDGKQIKDFSEAELHRFEHIRIQMYQDVSDPASLEETYMTYPEFIEVVNKRFKEFHMRELRNKQFKYDILQKNIVKTKVDQLNLSNPFELLDQLTLESDELLSSEVLDREVERLMQLIHETVELSNQEPSDSEIFETQGFLGECRKAVVSRVENLQEMAKRYFAKVKGALMLCDHCHGPASKYGTVFWCEEHNHYLCFHCGCLPGTILRPYTDETGEVQYENDKTLLCQSFKCIKHGTVISVKQEPFIKAFIAEMLASKIQSFLDLYTAIKVWTGGALTSKRAIYGFLKVVEAYVTMAWSQIFRKMAFRMFQHKLNCQSDIDLKVQTNAYLKHPKWERDTIDYGQKFAQVPTGSQTKYVCPHSLLDLTYTYCEGMYYVMLEEENLLIPDKICQEGKCALLNLAFLERIKNKFEVSPEYLEGYLLKRAAIISRYFPRFLWPLNFEKFMEQKNIVQKMFDKNWWEYYVSPLGSKVTEWIKKVCPLLLGVGILWASMKLYKHVWGVIGKIFGVNLTSEGLEQSSGERTRRAKGRQRGKKSSPFNTQAISENFDNKLNKISSNYIIVRCGKSIFTAWGLYNSTFLMPKHLLSRLTRDPLIQIAYVTRVGEFSVSKDNLRIVEYDNKDLARVDVLGQKIMFKDCSKFLQERKKFSLDNLTKGIFMDVDVGDDIIYDLDVQLLNIAHNTTASDSSGCNYVTDVGVMYNYQRTGACGSLVCVDSTNPVLSMHISGTDSLHKGIGVVLFQDDYMIQGAPEVTDTGENTPFFGEDCNIVYEGAIERGLVPFIPKKTQIVPSLISNVICEHPPLTQPAILDKSDSRYKHSHSPLYHGVVKNGKPTLDFPNILLEKAYAGIKDVLLGGSLIRKPTILTVKEAVLGFPQLHVEDQYMDDETQYYGAMPLDTSAGWPYATPKFQQEFNIKTTSKSGWISYMRDKGGFPVDCVIHDKVLKDHEEKMSIRSQGLPAINVFQDCLKDERRPIAKLEKEGGTRLFSMSNIEGTIALRRYTLDLTSHLRKNRLNNFIAVGINPESTEWTVLANMLLAKGNNIFTTDFSNFGAGLNYYCGLKFADLICDFYREKGEVEVKRNVVDALIIELMGSRHVVQNLIYRTQCGSPSGAAITVEMNSFVHMLYIMLSWIIIGEVYGKITTTGNLFTREFHNQYGELEIYLRQLHSSKLTFTVDDFYANVFSCVYGDDGIFSVTDEYREVFNSVTINLVLKEHGIGVTDASKSEQIVKYDKLSEATFLKRRFVPNELLSLLFAAQIQWQTVEECVRWIHKAPLTPEEATRENCEASLLLAWGHGREKYTWWLNRINWSLKQVNLRPIVLTWEDVGKKYFSDIVVS